MGVDVSYDVDTTNDAVGVDQEGQAACPVGELVVGRTRGAVGLARDVVDVGQQAIGVGLVDGEGLVLLGRVEADAEDLAAG